MVKIKKTTLEIEKELGRGGNITGDYAENLANRYYKGKLQRGSNPGSDIKKPNNERVEVKSRISRKTKRNNITETLVTGDINDWNFELLLFIIFDISGVVLAALEIPKDVAFEYSREHMKNNNCVGRNIRKSDVLWNDKRCKNKTTELKKIQLS